MAWSGRSRSASGFFVLGLDDLEASLRVPDQLLAVRPRVNPLRRDLEQDDVVVLGSVLEPLLELLVPELALALVVLDDLGRALDRDPRAALGRDVRELDDGVVLDLVHLRRVSEAEEPAVAVVF